MAMQRQTLTTSAHSVAYTLSQSFGVCVWAIVKLIISEGLRVGNKINLFEIRD